MTERMKYSSITLNCQGMFLNPLELLTKQVPQMNTDQYQQMLEKYKQRVEQEFGAKPLASPKVTSKEY